MKTQQVIFAALALFLVCGIAAADRLPSQVPENQKVSITTIIDVVGFVSDKTYMSWTINDWSTPVTSTSYSGDSTGTAHILTAAQQRALAAAKSGNAGFTYDTWTSGGNVYLGSIQVPDDLLFDLAFPSFNDSGDPWWGKTWQTVLNSLDADYKQSSGTEYGGIHDGRLNRGESIAIVTYSDSIRTNGGHLQMNKAVGFDSGNKGSGLSNLEAEKVITYESIDGSFLVGSEEWSLSVAGNYKDTSDSIRCVFASAQSSVMPAFCNTVKAKSELINFTSGQISTKGSLRAVAATGDVPAGLFYQIAVSPVSGSSSGFAEGTVRTEFAGSIMEARGTSDSPAATNQWSDKTSVSGGIKTFQKTFGYESGLSL